MGPYSIQLKEMDLWGPKINGFIYGYKRVITPISGVVTLLVTGKGPHSQKPRTATLSCVAC